MARRWTAAVAAAGLVLAGSADAKVFTWTLRGDFVSGYDATGVFGTPRDGLSDFTWRAVVVTDLATPGATYTDGGVSTDIIGSGPAVPVRVAFTLAGVTRRFGVVPDDPLGFGNADGDQSQVDGVLDGFPYDEYFAIEADNTLDYGTAETLRVLDEQVVLFGAGNGLNFLPGPDLTSLPSLTPPPGGLFGGSLRLFSSTDDLATGNEVVDEDVSAGLRITSIVAGAVPEPAAWAMMIVGFTALGAIARRRRDAAKAFG